MGERVENNLTMREILGYKMLLRTDDPGISRDLLQRGVREPAVVEALRQEIRPGDTVIDIGANIGYYAMLEAQLVGPEGIVYAIEPVPENYELLCKNIELNGFTNIKPYLLAIGDKKGKEKLHKTHQSNCGVILGSEPRSDNFMRRMEEIGADSVIEVDITTLDDFIKQEGIADPNFVRMDVEGYEIAVIAGMQETLKNARDLRIEMELHYGHYDDPEVITESLRSIFAAGFYQKYFMSDLGTKMRTNAHVLHAPYYRMVPHVLLEKRPIHVLIALQQIGYRGGAARALAVLANELSAREDIRVRVKVNREMEGWKDLTNLEVSSERDFPGIRNLYAWADVVFTQARMLPVVKEWCGRKPVVYYMHNDYRVRRSSNVYNQILNEQNVDLLLFNAHWVKENTAWEGAHLTVYPPVFPERFKTETSREYITQINLNEVKGGRVFYTLAGMMPDRQFFGVQGWGAQVKDSGNLKNVTVIPSTRDIVNDVYAKTRILLMPSQYLGDTEEFQWTESWGMVAVEAMSSGIPVIATPTPGLRESLGDAGIFVEQKDLDGWEAAIRKLDDPEVYAHYSQLAAARASELDPAPQIDALAHALKALGGRYLQGTINPAAIPSTITHQRTHAVIKNVGDRVRERGGYVFYPGAEVLINAGGTQLLEIIACADLSVIKAGEEEAEGDNFDEK